MSVRIESFEPPSGAAKWALPIIGGKVLPLNLALEMGKDGGKYSRYILISSDKAGKAYYEGSVKWDAMFIVKEMVDAQIALTYITNVPKGALCYIDGSELNIVLLAKILGLTKSHGVTVMWACSGTALAKHDMDGIFFPEVHPETQDSQEVMEILRGRLNVDLGTILKEIRASKAVLQWSKWGEANNIGSLYWNYQTVEKRLDGDVLRKAILSILG